MALEELENARKKRGGEDGEAAKINMDVIPSLNDLMQQGQEKKRRKRADTRREIRSKGELPEVSPHGVPGLRGVPGTSS